MKKTREAASADLAKACLRLSASGVILEENVLFSPRPHLYSRTHNMSSKVLKIAALAGDGIGPEVMREAIKVLRIVEKKFSLVVKITEAPVGWAGIDAAGKALPDATLQLCRESDCILFGSVGLPDRDPTIPKEERPERAALLRLRKEFGLFANLRPVKMPKELSHACPLTPERQGNGIDILVVRELTGGMYFGQPKKTEPLPGGSGQRAIDTMVYTTPEIERIAHVGFRAAQRRRKKLTSIDKANVLENGVLWREVVTGAAKQYPDVMLEHMFVDNAAMQLMLKPTQFDVMLCENMFGDILSDEAAALAGSLGMLPSASLGAQSGDRVFGFYEPAGGTAPDIAGKNLANPIAQILSTSLMLRHSFGLHEAAQAIDHAVAQAIASGIRTGDIFSATETKARKVGTTEMADVIAAAI
jgi:3-isopropylmalate dehydrogenase